MNRIQVYGAEWCHDTQHTLARLDELGVDYDYHDIDREPSAQRWVADHNGGKQKLPTLEVAGQILSVPEDEELDEALRGTGLSN
jgi:glutaredoxin